jgi:hypothetical protein
MVGLGYPILPKRSFSFLDLMYEGSVIAEDFIVEIVVTSVRVVNHTMSVLSAEIFMY